MSDLWLPEPSEFSLSNFYMGSEGDNQKLEPINAKMQIWLKGMIAELSRNPMAPYRGNWSATLRDVAYKGAKLTVENLVVSEDDLPETVRVATAIAEYERMKAEYENRQLLQEYQLASRIWTNGSIHTGK